MGPDQQHSNFVYAPNASCDEMWLSWPAMQEGAMARGTFIVFDAISSVGNLFIIINTVMQVRCKDSTAVDIDGVSCPSECFTVDSRQRVCVGGWWTAGVVIDVVAALLPKINQGSQDGLQGCHGICQASSISPFKKKQAAAVSAASTCEAT